MRVAVAQLATGLNKAVNLGAAVAAVDRAAADGAELVVLPEATMCSFGTETTDLVPLAETLDGAFVGTLAVVAAQRGVHVVAGMFEPAPVPGHVYNTVVAVGPRGLVGSYRKLHLYDALGWRESDRTLAGDPADGERIVVFAVGGEQVGVMNCYDLRFPEMGRVLVDRGATVLAVPAHFLAGPGKADTWATLLRARAIENTAYVLGAAKPAPECTGHSMVVSPTGEVLEALGGAEQGALAVAEVVPGQVLSVRQAVPVLAQRRFDVVPRP